MSTCYINLVGLSAPAQESVDCCHKESSDSKAVAVGISKSCGQSAVSRHCR